MKLNAIVLAIAAGALMTALAGCDGPRREGTSTARAPAPSQRNQDAATPPPGPMAASPTPESAAPAVGPAPNPLPASKIDDATVTAKVKAALVAEVGPVGVKVSVNTTDGKVTLTGEVPKDQIDRIVQVAQAVEGVHEIDNQLRAVGAG